MTPQASVALMKFLSEVAKKLGVGDFAYVVGGAVRNHVLGVPIKDIDLVIDPTVKPGKDSAWFAKQLQDFIPVPTSLVTNNYGVAILTINGPWELGGFDLKGEKIEIANARKESYGEGGYKPNQVEPATIEEDVVRREFTFNSLLWKLKDLADGPDKAAIIDLTGCGLKDLRSGEMRCPRDPDVVFSDDPSRMIRAVKFTIKYGFKIPPDLEASIRRNAQKLKQIPSGHISNMLIETFLRDSTGKKALLEMKRLGLLDVIREIAAKDKAFQATLAGWADSEASVEFIFDLMDLGMPVGKKLMFLSEAQRNLLWGRTMFMAPNIAEEYVSVLKQPGKVLDNQALIQEFGLKGPGIAVLAETARTVLLADPNLMRDREGLTEAVRQKLTMSKLASGGLKVYLDDRRPTPAGWVHARWPQDVIRLLKTVPVAEVSLDHDLGDDKRGTGYDVITWIEEAVATEGFQPPVIHIHTDNASGRMKMLAGVRQIQKLWERQQKEASESFRPLVARIAHRALKTGRAYFEVGDKISYGKYKNHVGVIRGFGHDKHGNPTVVFDPEPKGRKQTKEIGLYKIWRFPTPDKAQATLVSRVASRWFTATSEDVEKLFIVFRHAVGVFEHYLREKPSLAKYSWAPLINSGSPYARAVLAVKEIPPAYVKKMELAVRAILTAQRTRDAVAWWSKNEKNIRLLLAAHGWPDKVEGGESLFTVGPFKVHNTLGLSGEQLIGTKQTIEKVARKLSTSTVPQHISKVLYGDIFIVGQLLKGATLAWYFPDKDTVNVRPFTGKHVDEEHRLVHELGHRYLHKFAQREQKIAWARHHDSVRFQKAEVKLPDVGETLPVKVKGRKDYPVVTRKERGLIYYNFPDKTPQLGVLPSQESSIPEMQVWKYYRGQAAMGNYPTQYASTKWEEHFCESLALYILGKLSPEHREAFLKIWGNP